MSEDRAKLHQQFDWYSAEIEKARADAKKKRIDFLDADAKLTYLERDREIIWRQLIAPVEPPVKP